MIGPTDHIKLLMHLELCNLLQPNYWGGGLAPPSKILEAHAPGPPGLTSLPVVKCAFIITYSLSLVDRPKFSHMFQKVVLIQ